MNKNIPKKIIDITGIELTPGKPTVCLGNGEQVQTIGVDYAMVAEWRDSPWRTCFAAGAPTLFSCDK